LPVNAASFCRDTLNGAMNLRSSGRTHLVSLIGPENGASTGVVEMFRSRMDRPHQAGWLAEKDGAAVGYVLITLHDRAANVLHKPRRILEVVQIGVLPSHQRRGVGRALFNRVLEHAVASGVDDVVLSSWAFK
jgi:ribosomal protein S18 acetylase RimI-like enzyme